mmetsp:Transcript_36297/g.72183  ORF Transcript_36297/g.72183 Transcript_36297/m.72183 type:complete len:242 (-) Transcript_36297:181-906(-)
MCEWSSTSLKTVWSSTKSIIEQRTVIPPAQGGAAFAWNDMDMLETGNYAQAAHANGKQGTMSAAEYRSEFSMWAILASPLIVTTPIINCSSTDQIKGNYTPSACVPSLTALQKDILLNTEVLAINQDITPAGRLISGRTNRLDGLSGGTLLYARNLTDGSVAIALFNPSDDDAPAPAVKFATIGWGTNVSAAVRDLWLHVDLGVAKGCYPAPSQPPIKIAAHATVLLRLTPLKAITAHATT